MLRCDCCGRFHSGGNGSAWQLLYEGYPPEPYKEITRCFSCVLKKGKFTPQHGIKPKYSCGTLGN